MEKICGMGDVVEKQEESTGDLDVELSEVPELPIQQSIPCTCTIEQMFEIMFILTGAKSACKRRVSR